jgi:flagellar biosynthesis anti-sigma factor FlgM
MKVNNTTTQPLQNTEGAKAAERAQKALKSGNVDGAGPATGATSIDSGGAEISDRAKEMALASEVAKGAADIREAKIADLKKRIANKEYNVKPEAIADKLVDEHSQTRSLG